MKDYERDAVRKAYVREYVRACEQAAYWRMVAHKAYEAIKDYQPEGASAS